MNNPPNIVAIQSNTLQTVILSRNHLLGYHLALKFAENSLSTLLLHLPPSKVTYSLLDRHVRQEQFSPKLLPSQADYFVLVYPDIGDLRLLLEIAQSASQANSKLLIILNYRDLKLLDSLQNRLPEELNYRFAILTDPFGPYFLASPPLDQLSDYFSRCQSHQSITLPNQGQSLLYPTYITDLVPQLLKILFTSGSMGQTYWLSTLESISELDFYYQLSRTSQEVIDFSPPLELADSPSPATALDRDAIAAGQGLLNWHPQTELEEGIRQSLIVSAPLTTPLPSRESKPTPPAPSKTPPPKIHPPKPAPIPLEKLPPLERKFKRFFNPKAWKTIFFLGFVSLLILLPIVLFLVNSYLGATRLARAFDRLEQGSPQEAKTAALSARKNLSTARVLLQTGNQILFFLPSDKFVKYDRLLDAGSRLSLVAATGADTVIEAEQLYQIILGAGSSDLTTQSQKLKTLLESLYQDLSLVHASLEKINIDSSLSYIDRLSSAKEKLPEMLQQIQLGLTTLDLLPSLIGSTTPTTYVILFQNNAELRPTGGFIGSFAFITFAQGRLSDFRVEDVYAADGQLPGHVEPPAPLKKYLGEANWYLRDSNWFPHFPATAKQIEWFIDKETGRQVAGVIGINLHTVRYLLQATGPLTVAEFQETITADNLFERAEYRSEVNFFPGSTQKRDFLAALADELLLQIKTGKIPLTKLVKAINQSLSESQIIISVDDSQLQAQLEKVNWTGSLKNPSCPPVFTSAPCTSETFSLIEANLGVNKSNYFLDRRLEHNLFVERDGRLNHKLLVSYKNNSLTAAWPGGNYKTYTRLYAPLNSSFVSARFSDAEITPETINPSPEIGLQEIAFYYEVPVGESRQLEINLRSNQILSTKSPTSALSLNWEKQSGTNPDPLTVTIEYPAYLLPDQINLPAQSQPQKLIFSQSLSSDISFATLFRQGQAQ